jgi:hypothetical protein
MDTKVCILAAVTVLGFTAISLVATPTGVALEADVYLIKATSCSGIANFQETGFRLDSLDGVLTTLHGVAACSMYEADQGETQFKGMTLAGVDTANDLALLTSPQILKGTILREAASPKVTPDSLAFAWGHPLGIELNRAILFVNRPPLRTLRDLLPDELKAAAATRLSPDPKIQGPGDRASGSLKWSFVAHDRAWGSFFETAYWEPIRYVAQQRLRIGLRSA